MLKFLLDQASEDGSARYSESSLWEWEIRDELQKQLKLVDDRVAAAQYELTEVRKMRKKLRFDLDFWTPGAEVATW
jgi:hypothetical protein